jgi:hypothetical protein
MMHKMDDQWYLARHPLHLTGDAKTFQGHDNAVSGAPSALGLSLPFGFDNYAAFC